MMTRENLSSALTSKLKQASSSYNSSISTIFLNLHIKKGLQEAQRIGLLCKKRKKAHHLASRLGES